MIDTSEKFSWLVRLGYAARGITYLLLGYIALSTHGDANGGATSSFDFLQEIPLGGAILWLVVIGLIGYAAFKFLSGISDIQNRGRDGKAIAKRIGDVASGIAHILLAYTAFQFANGARQQASSDSGGEQMAGSALNMDIGWLAVGAVGLGFLIGAAMQAKGAWTASFMHRISPRAPAGVEVLGRAGQAARAVVFAIIGWSLVQGAWITSEGRIMGLGEAVMTLRDNDLLYMLVAIGLLAFGLFSFVTARYRIIPHLDKHQLKPSLRA
jgi:hypothetical protein